MKHTLEIPGYKKILEFASCLEELTPDQAEYFTHLYTLFLNKDIDASTFRLWLAIYLLKIKSSVRYYSILRKASTSDSARRDQEWMDAVNGNLLAIADTLKSFFSYDEETDLDTEHTKQVKESLKFDCIKNIMPRIKGFYGPADALTDCSFWEYKEAHNAFVAFASTMDENDLLRLAAILYRPKKWFMWIRKRLPNYNGQIRRKLSPKSNPLLVERRMKKIGKASYAQLYYVFLFFKSCEQYLLNGTPTIDGKEINLSVLYEGSESSGDSIGLTGVLFTLAETSVFGDIDKTADTGLYDVLSRLYQVTIQFKQINKKNDPDTSI